MSPELLTQTLLRLLPSIALLIVGFLAALDARIRQRWTNLLYQLGSLKPDQKDDPQAGKGVKIPFFIVSLLFLAWPILYYRDASRTPVITLSPSIFLKKPTPTPKEVATPTPIPAPKAPPPPPQ